MPLKRLPKVLQFKQKENLKWKHFKLSVQRTRKLLQKEDIKLRMS